LKNQRRKERNRAIPAKSRLKGAFWIKPAKGAFNFAIFRKSAII
jgi:hypothetical protein